MDLTKRKILKHALLPGFWPRIRSFFNSGFVHIAYLTAIIYQNVRLLPPGHPYLNPENFGRYGVRHVIAEASNNLVFSRKNIDQILVFFMILAGMVLLLLQFVLLIMALFASQPAIAISLNWLDVFGNPSPSGYSLGPTQDLAFMTLDRVFGLEGIYNSCVSTGATCVDIRNNAASNATLPYPFPIHKALHTLLRFYSLGIVMIGILVIIYFITTIAGETAESGTPFGSRFNKAWVPFRLIMFFALLAPLNIGGKNEGLNGAQIITFYAARWGSNMATNSWGRFNKVLTRTYLGQASDLIAEPNPPEIGALNQFFFVAKMCQIAEGAVHNIPIKAFIIRERMSGSDRLDFMTSSYTVASNFANKGNIVIRFGHLDPGIAAGNANPSQYDGYKAYVKPLCGEIQLEANDSIEPGALGIQEDYYDLLQDLWDDPDHLKYAECVVRRTLPINPDNKTSKCPWPDLSFAKLQQNYFDSYVSGLVTNRINQQVMNGNWALPPGLLEKGWAGAAIWYNRIAKMNGAVTMAVMNIPRPTLYPFVMEEIAARRRAMEFSVDGSQRFDPLLSDKTLADLPREGDQYIAASLYAGFKFWADDTILSSPHTEATGNVIIDAINMIYGTNGLFEMRKNPSTHPLAQLSALGSSIVQAAVRNTLFAVGGAVGEGITEIFKPFVGDKMAKVATSLFTTFVRTSLVIGIMLYYVLPFLPFIYFFFAFSGWIKSIFEAIVAMPLWALAHIRIDGEGLPGPGATNGYYLLLEIVLRPTLIVFGLLASISIFSALVMVLNDIFAIVVANMGGFDVREEVSNPLNAEYYRGPVDEFFFTAIYVIICYMSALSIFKMIDAVPNNILRWIGVTVSTFQENAGDPASELSSKVYKGSQIAVSQASGTLTGGRLAHIVST